MGNTINIILGVVIVLGILAYFNIIEINDEDEIRNIVNDNIDNVSIPEQSRAETFDCTNGRECAEILGMGGRMENANAIGNSASARICGLYVADLKSQLTPDELVEMAFLSSKLFEALNTHVILYDENVDSVLVKRTTSMSGMNAQYCVEGNIEFMCYARCISGDLNRGYWDLVISSTSLEHTGKCQKYVDEHVSGFPDARFYQLLQRHCLV